MKIEKPVLLSGANGFTGRFVCKELKKRNIPFIVILRPNSDPTWMQSQYIDYRFVDLRDTKNLQNIMYECSSLLNVASIGFGDAPSIIKACENAGITRAVFVSSTSIFTKLNASSKSIRLSAESSIRSSKLQWTILRPTMIYGSARDRNMIRLIKWIDKKKILPIFGNGESLQQPIFVSDLAWSIVEVLNDSSTYFKLFNLSGKYPISFNEVIKVIELYLNTKTFKLYLSAKITILILRFFELLKIKLPIKSEQIERLNENKSFEHSYATKYFKFSPKSFNEGIKLEVENYLKKNKL